MFDNFEQNVSKLVKKKLLNASLNIISYQNIETKE